MSFRIDLENNRLIFDQEMNVFDAENIVNTIKDNLDTIQQWDYITIDLLDLKNLDSSIIQILLSLNKAFPNNLRFTAIPAEIEDFFKTHGLKLKKIEQAQT